MKMMLEFGLHCSMDLPRIHIFLYSKKKKTKRERETTKHKRISEEMHTDLSFISNAHGKEQLMVKNVVWRKKCMKMY